MEEKTITEKPDINNIYKLDGKIPAKTTFLLALQHILAMFVANMTPIILITGVAKVNGAPLAPETIPALIQNSMLVAGIATMIQVCGIGVIGSRLPIVMGVSFTFLSVMMQVAAVNFNTAIGAVIVGGCVEGILGLTYKYWKRLISPVVAACVVSGIGISLFPIGITSLGGGNPMMADFGSIKYWLIGIITLVFCIVAKYCLYGYKKTYFMVFGLIIGYIFSYFFGMVDFSNIWKGGIFACPGFLPTGMPEFELSSIISMIVIFLVSATETIGDTAGLCQGVLDRNFTEKEGQGSLACDGFASALAGLFGSSPITSFSQNVGLVTYTKAVNRSIIKVAGGFLILASFFPPIARFLHTIPQPVLGGCTIIIFGQIFVIGLKMLSKIGYNDRNIFIISLSLAFGVGFSETKQIFNHMPALVQNLFANNMVAVVFLVAIVLDLTLPKDTKLD